MSEVPNSERDRAEIARSASQARKTVLQPGEIDRYLDPPADGPYPLEYAFHLLGDVRGKTVLDLGCGTGENIIPLLKRGAKVIAMDISPDLVALAQQRVREAQLEAAVKVGSAYETGLADESVDVIFCISLIHHLDIERAQNEMSRVLTRNGAIILKEPIRFSQGYARIRGLLPAHKDISEFEHPLTREELAKMMAPFEVVGARYFRLPFVPLALRFFPTAADSAWRASDWMLQRWPITQRYATAVAMRLQK
jgi:ubiquinone/menaquinone biosynthesis C-methylase UbiE